MTAHYQHSHFDSSSLSTYELSLLSLVSQLK